ncbi:MAG: Dyp-type peroxidase [Actinomycetota bacterium]|nr:Dyp-type peroxidase [Actinomycetota bacterium]
MSSSLSHPARGGDVRVDTVPSVQPVTTPLTCAAIFLVATIEEGGEASVHEALPELAGFARAIGFRDPTKRLALVTSIGSDAWDRLFTGPRPAELHPFVELTGPRHSAPATPGDLLFHIKGETMDVCFELAGRIVKAIGGAITVVDEVHGFRFFDNRDLLGFVDGTENPVDDEALDATAVGDEDPDFAGGSYVHIQKYLHDMAAWEALPVTEQERVIGRTKADDIEFDDAVKPADSHIALNVITDEDGNELDIVRHNMPFGTVGSGESGTYYIGYARSPQVTEQMLRNMFLGDPPGNTDRILDFSTAITGGLFFTPTADFLDDPPPLPGAAVPAPTEAVVPVETGASGAGELNIGSLKGISQ